MGLTRRFPECWYSSNLTMECVNGLTLVDEYLYLKN